MCGWSLWASTADTVAEFTHGVFPVKAGVSLFFFCLFFSAILYI